LGEVRITMEAAGVDQLQGNALEDDLEADDLLDDAALRQKTDQAQHKEENAKRRVDEI
jgi:hypothetical protein